MSTSQSTDRPTNYFSYRLTRPHTDWPVIREIIDERAQNWLVVEHGADHEVTKPHFHMIFLDLYPKCVDGLKLAFSRHFDEKGNGLHAGKWCKNDIIEAVSYMKHDSNAVFHASSVGADEWARLLDDAPIFIKKDIPLGKVYKEKLTDPTLTHSNVLKQAVKFQAQNMPTETSLQNVLSRMVHQSSWVPSRDLLRNGVPREFHEMFHDRVSKKQRTYAWMAPHVPSDDKVKWLDRPDSEPIIAGTLGTCPGNSQKLWTGKDMKVPSLPSI